MRVQLLEQFFFILVVLTSSICASMEPCSPMDSASSPAVRPHLFIKVDEASQQDLNTGGGQYINNIRLYGVYGSKTSNGIKLSFGSTYHTVDPREYFAFELESSSPFQNKIRLIKPIDRDGETDSVMDDTIVDNFRLKCVPNNNTTLEYWYDVSLLINDINDNGPQLSESNIYSAVVNELTPVGSMLPITITATDKDSGRNRQLTYKIPASDVSSSTIADYFMIQNETGRIFLQKSLDYEGLVVDNKKIYTQVIVHDNGKLQQFSSTATLTLTVIDGDDQGPQFDHLPCQKAFGGKCFTPTYVANVENIIENSPILFQSSGGGPLMTIKAKDGDTLAAKIEFKIAAVLPSQYKSSFRLTVIPPESDSNGYYAASLKLIKSIDKSSLAGTVIYITASEDTPRHLSSVARIMFKGKNSEVNKMEKLDNKYTGGTLALIVVVAILAVLTVIAIGGLIFCCKRTTKSVQMNGHINEGMSHL